MSTTRLNLRRVALAVGLLIILALALFLWGRALWHPVLAWVQGVPSVGDRLRAIAATHPGLQETEFRDLALIADKRARRLEVWNAGTLWRTYPILAASGKPGPKTRAGDNQVPEGVYRIDAVNPASTYHLSLRVSYPDAADLRRSAALGVTDPGGDIYIHGGAASIGCVAIGDPAIEEVFYAVCTVGYGSVRVIITPSDPPSDTVAEGEVAELYDRIARAMVEVRGASRH